MLQHSYTCNKYAPRTSYSTIISLVNSTEHWRQNADNQKINVAIFLGLKKSFDTINRRILIDKLMKYGVKGTEIELFKLCLSAREQFCTVNGKD